MIIASKFIICVNALFLQHVRHILNLLIINHKIEYTWFSGLFRLVLTDVGAYAS